MKRCFRDVVRYSICCILKKINTYNHYAEVQKLTAFPSVSLHAFCYWLGCPSHPLFSSTIMYCHRRPNGANFLWNDLRGWSHQEIDGFVDISRNDQVGKLIITIFLDTDTIMKRSYSSVAKINSRADCSYKQWQNDVMKPLLPCERLQPLIHIN